VRKNAGFASGGGFYFSGLPERQILPRPRFAARGAPRENPHAPSVVFPTAAAVPWHRRC